MVLGDYTGLDKLKWGNWARKAGHLYTSWATTNKNTYVNQASNGVSSRMDCLMVVKALGPNQ